VDYLWATKSEDVGLIVCTVSKNFNLCGPDPPTSQTETDDMRSQDRDLHYSASRGKNLGRRNALFTPDAVHCNAARCRASCCVVFAARCRSIPQHAAYVNMRLRTRQSAAPHGAARHRNISGANDTLRYYCGHPESPQLNPHNKGLGALGVRGKRGLYTRLMPIRPFNPRAGVNHWQGVGKERLDTTSLGAV